MKYSKIVKSIAYADSNQILDTIIYPDDHVRLPQDIKWQEICARSHPSLVSESKIEDNNMVVSTTIKLYTADDLPQYPKKLDFKVELIDGTKLLVGSKGRPYTTVEITKNCPESVKDNQLNEVVISYKSNHFPYNILE
jgi:hypothetical protein